MVGALVRRSRSIHAAARTCFSARAARGNLLVGDVAHEDVPEGELLLVAHRRDACRSYELPANELAKPGSTSLAIRPPMAARAPVQNTFPRTDASWSERFQLGVERVQARGDERVHGLRHAMHLDALLGSTSMRDELLRVEGIAARPLEQRGLRLGGKDRPLEQRRDEPSRVLVRQRRRDRPWSSCADLLPSSGARRTARAARSRGRAAASPRAQSSRCSTKSSSASSAQCRSSSTSTSGRRAASASR